MKLSLSNARAPIRFLSKMIGQRGNTSNNTLKHGNIIQLTSFNKHEPGEFILKNTSPWTRHHTRKDR